MGELVLRAAVVAAALTLIGAGRASAQAPSYGGGLLPSASPPTRAYTPTVGIALQPRGDRIALRFDTSIRCGRESYDAVGRKVVPFDGAGFTATGASVYAIGTSHRNRVRFAWALSGAVDGAAGSGTLRIAGVRVVNGRRTRCARKPTRSWQARLVAPAPAGTSMPAARAAFGGLSDLELADDLRAPVILKVAKSARKVAARWTVTAGCQKRRSRQHLINLTPPTTIRSDGSFKRSERFGVSYADAFIRYRVTFSGRFSGDGATGTLRMRAREYSRDRKRFRRRCDSGVRSWSAALLRPAATTPVPPSIPPPPSTTNPPVAQSVVPTSWSLQMTSDAGDYIGQGQTWSHAAPDRASASASPSLITLSVDTPDAATWWTTDFAAPPGKTLHTGTYTGARRYPFNDGAPGFAHGGTGRGCNELTATFTIHELVFGAGGRLQRFRATFEQHCEGAEPALRGTWDFTA